MRVLYNNGLARAQDLTEMDWRYRDILVAWNGVISPDSASAALFET